MKEYILPNDSVVRYPDDEHQLLGKIPPSDEVWFKFDVWKKSLALKLITIGYDINETVQSELAKDFPEESVGIQARGMMEVLSYAEKIANNSIAAGNIKEVDTPENWIKWAQGKGYKTKHLERALAGRVVTIICSQDDEGMPLYIGRNPYSGRQAIPTRTTFNDLDDALEWVERMESEIAVGNLSLPGSSTKSRGHEASIDIVELFEPLSYKGLAEMFKITLNPAENEKLWREWSNRASRNGLVEIRETIRPAKYNPVLIGNWLANNNKLSRDRINRVLIKNLSPQNQHLKYLIDGEID